MGAGREYSRFQQGVIKRYYRNLDTITLQRLSEIVSELYIETAAGGKKVDRLWQRAADTLSKTDANDARVAQIIQQRNLEQLARLVSELSG
ncbi:MAG: hypothetical protein ACF8R7_01910 [Phycisphaerales bacterium JB039]